MKALKENVFNKLEQLKAEILDSSTSGEFLFIFEGYVDTFYRMNSKRLIDNLKKSNGEGIYLSTKLIMFNNLLLRVISHKEFYDIKDNIVKSTRVLSRSIQKIEAISKI